MGAVYSCLAEFERPLEGIKSYGSPCIARPGFRLRATVSFPILWRLLMPDKWPSGLYTHCQVTGVKLDRVRSDSGWVTSEV